MRPALAIFLLVILILNFTGYKFLFSYLEQNAQSKMEALIDKKTIRQNELTEIKIGLHNAYLNNGQLPERYNGKVEINGIIYSFVERKMEGDTLVLVCTQNKESNKIRLEATRIISNIFEENSTKNKTNTNAGLLLLKAEFVLMQNGGNVSFKNIAKQRLPLIDEPFTASAFADAAEKPPRA